MPGDKIGEITLSRAPNKNGDFSIFNYCDPHISIQRPVTLVTECRVPRSDYLFVGYGEFASSMDELDSTWQSQTWELYIDGKPLALSSFGAFDVDLGNKVRVWNIALENISPGLHKLRYVSYKTNKPQDVNDLTWVFTVIDQIASATPPPTIEAGSYPVLSSAFMIGLNPYKSEKANLNFMFYVPAQYGKDTQQKWPLILYLHGIGLRGDDLNELRFGELPAILQYEADFPFLAVAPQMPWNDENPSWSRDEMVDSLLVLLDEVQEKYSVDSNRIYLTGASLGGGGTWEIGLRYPTRFAALAPVMGFYGYPFGVPDHICDLKDVPVWAFHGENDLTVPLEAEKGLVDALTACGGNVKFTVYEDAGHDVDARTYKNPELFTWMLAQSLK